jgi:hypothetical protein
MRESISEEVERQKAGTRQKIYVIFAKAAQNQYYDDQS